MIRVLLADDAADMRLMLRLVLETDGRFEVVGEAADGLRAMELVELHNPDILILDMAMPEMDGLQVLSEIRSRGADVRVLAFSGFHGKVEERATALGVDGYLRKGTTVVEELVPTLLALCA